MALILISVKGASSVPGSLGGGVFSQVVHGYSEDSTVPSLTPLQNAFMEITSLPLSQTQNENLTAQAIQTIQDSYVVSTNSLVSDIIDDLSDRSNKVVEYEVQEGDTISSIASDFRISINAIVWANKLPNINAIKPGMNLNIPPVTGVIHAIKKGDSVSSLAQYYGVGQDKIIEFNGIPLTGDLRIGQDIIIPDGILPQVAKTPQRIISNRFALLPKLDGYFSAPTSGIITQRIHGRNGVDIANRIGTPIYSAAEGTIIVSKTGGWNSGYGNYIKIIHPNGTETLYSHLGKVLVAAGQAVSQGTEIGKMGSTGKSTGSHLHFEVHGAQNPLATR